MSELPKHISIAIDFYDPTITLSELTDSYIVHALKHFDWNIGKAAKALGVTPKTIYNFLYNKNIDIKQLRIQLYIQKIQANKESRNISKTFE